MGKQQSQAGTRLAASISAYGLWDRLGRAKKMMFATGKVVWVSWKFHAQGPGSHWWQQQQQQPPWFPGAGKTG